MWPVWIFGSYNHLEDSWKMTSLYTQTGLLVASRTCRPVWRAVLTLATTSLFAFWLTSSASWTSLFLFPGNLSQPNSQDPLMMCVFILQTARRLCRYCQWALRHSRAGLALPYKYLIKALKAEWHYAEPRHYAHVLWRFVCLSIVKFIIINDCSGDHNMFISTAWRHRTALSAFAGFACSITFKFNVLVLFSWVYFCNKWITLSLWAGPHKSQPSTH